MSQRNSKQDALRGIMLMYRRADWQDAEKPKKKKKKPSQPAKKPATTSLDSIAESVANKQKD